MSDKIRFFYQSQMQDGTWECGECGQVVADAEMISHTFKHIGFVPDSDCESVGVGKVPRSSVLATADQQQPSRFKG